MKNRSIPVLAMVIGTAGLCLALPLGAQPATPDPAAKATQPRTPVQGRASIEFERLEHDFGTIIDVEPVYTEFRFVNNGTEPLHITRMQPDCGCTQPTADRPATGASGAPGDQGVITYGPGESGVIKIGLKPQGKHGAKTQKVTIDTNDPERGTFDLKIHANVIQLVEIEPPVVSFGEVQIGHPSTQRFTVTGRGEDFAATYASVAKGRLFSVKAMETKPVEADGETLMQTHFEVTYNGGGPKGNVQTPATVRTTDDRVPLTSVQVIAEIVGEIRVLPPAVNCGTIPPGESFTRLVRVNTRSNKPFHITKVDQQHDALAGPMEVNVTPLAEGEETAWQLEIKGTAGPTQQPINASLTLTTDVPGEEQVVVKLMGAVRPTPRFDPPPIPERGPVGPELGPTDAPPPR